MFMFIFSKDAAMISGLLLASVLTVGFFPAPDRPGRRTPSHVTGARSYWERRLVAKLPRLIKPPANSSVRLNNGLERSRGAASSCDWLTITRPE